MWKTGSAANTGGTAKSEAETEAFHTAVSNLDHFSISDLPVPRPPKRLLNIHTGVLEPGDFSKKYVIVSYIWDPSSLPLYPRQVRRPDRDDTWEYSTECFDRIIELASDETYIEQSNAQRSRAWLVEVDPDFEVKASRLAHPNFPSAKSPLQAAYFREVCSLACVEAADRNVDYIWMDSLCINQADPADIADQLPCMADYFRGAEVCVVVSEMLRRGLAHRIDRLGADVLNAHYATAWELSWESRPKQTEEEYRNTQRWVQEVAGLTWAEVEYTMGDTIRDNDPALQGIDPKIGPVAGDDEEERCYRAKWGLADEIAGWLVSFQEFRVWTFQETCLAAELVHRGRNVRINTAAALVIDEYWTVYNDLEIALLPIQYLPNYQKKHRLLHLRRQYLKRLQYRLPLPFCRVGDTVNGLGSDEPEWSPNQCLSIIRAQNRTSLFKQDVMYGVLGLFPPLVRHALPVRYDISVSAIFAFLIYILICSGDLSVFFVDEDHTVAPHNIASAPSWIPRRYGEMGFRQPKIYCNYRLQKGALMKVDGRKLVLRAPYLNICECKDVSDDDNIVRGQFWMIPSNPLWKKDSKLDMQTQPDRYAVPLSTRGRPRFPKVYLREVRSEQREKSMNCKPPSQLTTEEVKARRRVSDALKKEKLVMVNFAVFPTKLLWFALEFDDERKTWTKVGEIESGSINVGFDGSDWVKEFVIE